MNYVQAMEYLDKASKRGSILGLESMQLLLEELHHPEQHIMFIHVAGTNGKGSIASFLVTALSYNGYRVGRYSSPAVFESWEIIQCYENEEKRNISQDEVGMLLERIQEAECCMKQEKGIVPTRFEIETALAFLSFKHWNCDICVVEVGMGGATDATNVIPKPICTIFSPISMDHMAFLGDTIEKIANVKAGIIKGGPVISQQHYSEAEDVLVGECQRRGADYIPLREEQIVWYKEKLPQMKFSFHGREYTIPLFGKHQVDNACTALLALERLEKHFHLQWDKVGEGMQKTVWMGRFEVLQEKPYIIGDGAHNPYAAICLRQACEEWRRATKYTGCIRAVFGIFRDKDYVSVCREMMPILDEVTTVNLPSARGLPAEVLAEECNKYGIPVFQKENVQEGIHDTRERASNEDMILIFGTLSFLSDALSI